ncbi:hypothetical protein [Argonema galeatum]|uniref:hypothetical protein n=1 Tax=Argonema galeatum TaxID=2942762 RepID=UPI002012031D|nr:hypothetical protein [Argonema galeatum]
MKRLYNVQAKNSHGVTNPDLVSVYRQRLQAAGKMFFMNKSITTPKDPFNLVTEYWFYEVYIKIRQRYCKNQNK